MGFGKGHGSGVIRWNAPEGSINFLLLIEMPSSCLAFLVNKNITYSHVSLRLKPEGFRITTKNGAVMVNSTVSKQMASCISSYEKISQMKQINGVSIGEIEKRARPNASSQSGFLGESESLKNLLKNDWKTVKTLDTTHIELAEQLSRIWDQSNNKSGFILYKNTLSNHIVGYSDSVSLGLAILISAISIVSAAIFTPYALFALIPAGIFFTMALTNRQFLYVSYLATKGKQEDIFDPKLEFLNGWNDEITIRNLLTGTKITVARGVIEYIRKYGFYEGGGNKNPYRIDPIRLTALLTGSLPSRLRSKISHCT